MNTNNSGSADPAPDANTGEEKNRSVPLPLLVAGLVAVLFMLFIGIEVIPVLYAVIFPPSPPLPDNVTLVSHTSQDHGSDDWMYDSDQSTCTAVKFYQDKGGICKITPECNPAPSDESGTTSRTSHCTGEMAFSIFAMRWQVDISPQFDNKSRLHLSRQVFWTGAIDISSDQPIATP